MKSYTLSTTRKKKKRSSTGSLITGATNALLGVALVSATADALHRL